MSDPTRPDAPGDATLSPIKRAIVEIRDLRARLEEAERRTSEPVAVIGMAVRLPGDVETPDAFWALLREGRDAITEVPADRWRIDDFYDPDPAAAGRMSTRYGGFLARPDLFDARFFGITPREAATMDPQQRLLLEVAWEALEHAGQAPDRLAGHPTGVFVGLSAIDYLVSEIKFSPLEAIDAYVGSGGSPAVAAGRLAYVLGLQGPSLSVDTACSSSLSAVHLACQSLRLGECRMAIAGGVNLILLPEFNVNFSKAGMMAADGRCKTFDERADGYVRSEGCGVVVLKRLSDALANRDRILGVIRGSALNQDGRSSGLTVPNGQAQEAVIREALARAGVTPAEVGYVEAHGTGTSLGDPIELRALGRVFAEGRAAGQRLAVGSVKTNLGHLEAAAGVAGLIKVLLAFQHGEIPPHLHVETPTPHVPWASLPIEVTAAAKRWAPGDGRRIAGISSFGFSGANAHVIVEEPPLPAARETTVDRPLHVLTVSARTAPALRDAVSRLAGHLDTHAEPLGDVCFTANAGRAHFGHRAAVVAPTLGEAIAALHEGPGGPRVRTGDVPAGAVPDVAFLFGDAGAIEPGRARQLFETQPAFRAAIERCDRAARGAGVALVDALYPASAGSGPQGDAARVARFALQYALAEMWMSWGVTPRFAAGHGVGLVAAGCAAGALAIEDGLALVMDRFAAPALPASRPRVALVSPPTGALATGDELVDPAFWRSTPGGALEQAVATIRGRGVRLFVDIGPAAADAPPSWSSPRSDADAVCLASLGPDDGDWTTVSATLAELYVRGVGIRWDEVDRGHARRRVDLPTYPFQRERYWSDAVKPRTAETPTRGGRAVEDAIYEIVWRPSPAGDPPHGPALAGTTWVVVGEGDTARRLVVRLRGAGATALAVAADESAAAGPDAFRVDPNDAEQVRRLWREGLPPVIDAVVYVAAPAESFKSATGLDVQASAVDACGGLLHVVQAIVRSERRAPRLFVVTHGAQAAGDAAVNVSQAPVSGLASAIAMEHPELACTQVDLDPDSASEPALWQELSLADDGERLVARQGGVRWVARLERRHAPRGEARVRADATYLITGGTGGLGLKVAEWLADRGARHLALVSRRGATGEAPAAVQGLVDRGCQVTVAAGSVADATFVSGLLARIDRSMPPLAGIVHAAGAIDDGVVTQQSRERLAAVMAPKVAGAWNLHRATADRPLDFFVLFSSVASLIGSPGQANYAAANAFLDALAHHRRRAGLPGTSINWGGWRDTGMAAGRSERRGADGVGQIDPELGLEAMGRLASASAPAQAAVLSIDWPTFLRGPGAPRRTLVAELAGGDTPAAEASDLAARWNAAAPGERVDLVFDHVRQLVVDVLALDARERIDPKQGLIDLGMDSLMALELRNRLQRSVGRPLPPTVVFDHPSLADLAAYVEREALAPAAAPAAVPVRAPRTTARETSTEPVAIVGIGCRMPGGADSPDRFWTLLRDGVDAITEVPRERWNADAFYDPDPGAAGKMITRWGGFVADVDRFDPQFFGIAPREAASMDPQHRLLLEVCWEALEHAGQPADRLQGSATGVFVGISGSDYAQLQMRGVDARQLDAHYGTGGAVSVAAGRLAYSLGLQGPALAVDTACSSSLVAVHLACQALRQGDCTTALAGGVNLILAPETNVILSRARMLSPEGRCKTFDASADGYVRSDGCGIVVLKRLSDATACGDRILAVIRGTAVNQDGRSGGLTVPNGPAQEALMRQALAASGIAPAQVDYVEAHGTGTSLGDPIEVRALGAVFGGDRSPDRPLRIGSVKSNIGHLEAAAGIAGLIKVVLALQHEQIPPHLHLRELNPLISLDPIPAAIPTALSPWPSSDGRRIAGVSSFGFSGTNAHAVVEEAPRAEGRPEVAPERPRHILALSAKTPAALRRLAARHAEALARETTAPVADLAFTANAGRTHFSSRLAVTGATARELREALAAAALPSGEPSEDRPKVVFLFTGQGAQYAGMARSLFDTQPAFREALERCDILLRPLLDRSLLDVMFDPALAPLLDQTAYTQPALFALEYALARMWQSWGIEPAAAIGHSVGEFVAATIAGALSVEDGLRLVAARGRLMQALPAGGAMAAVLAGEARVREVLAASGSELAVAAVNAPDNVVIAGPAAAVESACARLAAEGIETRALAVSHAFHSALVEPMLDEFERIAAGAEVRDPAIPIVSNLTGRFLARGERLDAAYWRRHARGAVRFAEGMQALADAGYRTFLEVGPHPTLLGLGRRAISVDGARWLPSLRRGADDWRQLLDTLADLYAAGAPVDWAGFDRGYRRSRVTAPTYPFERERYWLPDPRPRRTSLTATAPVVHPLLGRELRSRAIKGTVYESEVGAAAWTWLREDGAPGPAAAGPAICLEIALAAAGDGGTVHELSFAAPLDVSGPEPTVVQMIVSPGAERRFEILSGGSDGAWRVHATGQLEAERAPNVGTDRLDDLKRRCPDVVAGSSQTSGVHDEGPGVRIWRGAGEAIGHVTWPHAEGPCLTHATLLDICAVVARAAVGAGDVFGVPAGMRAFALSQPLGSSAWIHARTQPSPDALHTDLAFFAEDGTPVGRADTLRLGRGDAAEESFASDWLYQVAWRRLESADRPDGPGLSALVPVAALDGAVQARAAHLTTETGVRAYGSALGALESLATAFVVDALRTLGWHAEVGTRITEPEVARALGVVSGHRRLLRRLLEMLEEDGILVPAADGWEVARELPPGQPAIADAGAAIGQVAAHELTLLTRCGQHLAGALRGEVDALELLFPGGATEGTEQVYSASPVARLFNGLVTEAVETLARSLPADRSLRILEVGAGTGGTTAAVLAAVPPARTRYVFTDLSPLFLQRAAEKFRHYPFVEYALYDAERDASAQPLPLSEFDLIVAANVLHATHDLRATVERLTALLAPGGMVLFAEATRPQRWLDLTFGLTEGWWRFDDRELRPRHALLPRRGWTDLLDALGFEGAVALPHVPDPRDPVEGHALIVASWPGCPREGRGAIGGRPWLVLGDASGLGAAIARRLRARGADCVEARVGSTTAAVGEKLWTVDPAGSEGLSRLIAMALPGGTAGVIDCWPLDAPTVDAASPESLERATALVGGGALLAVQALVAARSDARLWVVTRDAVAAAPNDAARGAVQAAAWGLGRVVALEQPEVWGGLIDVADDDDLDRTATRIVQRLESPDVEDQVALRPGGTFVARLASAGPMRVAPAEFRRDATYLVTGGTGGVGLLVAGEMARLGAGHLVLVSRSGVPARDRWDDVEPGTEGHRQVSALREIEALGAAVTVQTADITAPTQVAALMEVLRALPPLRGVVHAAAHIETGRVRDLSVDRMATMLRPKVTGAWLLDRATRDADLDFFVLFSSTAGVFGATDLAHYAAANVFLDSFAHARTAAGRPAVSVAWGTWAQIRGSDEAHRSIDRGGLKIMPRDRTLEAFRRLARPACPQLVFADVDWGTLKPLYETRRRRPIFDEVGVRPVPQAMPGAAPVRVRDRLQQARPNERRAVLLTHVRQEAAQVLGLQPAQVDPRKGLFDLGMDSLMSVDLKGRLEASLGVRMPTTLTFNYPSVGAITDYVAGLLAEAPEGVEAATTAATGTAAAPGGADPDPDESLSEDELATLLAAQLEKMRQ